MATRTETSPELRDRSLDYRPYLDGLRGVAVLLVFVFHAARSGLPGGFIGVDIFFVLSGYLITRILLVQKEKAGRIDLPGFYARRIRRLMPAVIVLVLVVVAREALYGDILELGSRLRDAIATLFYVENWNLISQADQYFAEGTSASPLRHAWSLSIEEQFYILWPVLLIPVIAIGRKWKGWSALVVLALALASAVAMALLYTPEGFVRAYYGTDTRVQQPLIGALLAFAFGSPIVRRIRERAGPSITIVGVLAFLSLLAAAVLFSGNSAGYYKGGSLLVAALTAVLILAMESRPEGSLSAGLGWNPLRQLGRISYGFYLWHWPIILWLAIPEGVGFWGRRVVNLAQFGLTLAVAIASFWLVENPIRERQVWLGKLKPMGTICIGIATLVAAGFISYAALTPDETNLAAAALADPSYEACPENPQPCVKVEGLTADAPTVVLVGDSTAQAYDPALKELAAIYGFRYVQAAVGGCPISHRLIATGLDGELHKPSNFMCYEEMPGIYQRVLDEYDPDLVIATSWNETNQHVEGDKLLLKGTPEHLRATESALRETVDLLTSHGAQLAFLDVLPPGKTVDCLKTGSADSAACTRPVTPESGERPYNEIFDNIAADLDKVASISLEDVVCPHESCPLTIDNIVMRYDGGHFTGTASRHLAPIIDARLAQEGINLSHLGD
jgi:peptidoglycan/LPS O-acetylase OafA/YrhL